MGSADSLLVAVYGTLRRGGGGRRRAGLRPADLTEVGPCRLRGRLVDLGAYPGLVEAGDVGGETAGRVGEAGGTGKARGTAGPGASERAAGATAAEVRGAGLVVGELVRCAGPDVLARLDAFEGYDPLQPWDPLFLRRRRTLVEPAGVEAWVYVFAGHPAGLPEVAGGDWMRR